MAKRTLIEGPIPSMQTPWDDGTSAYLGEAVEQFIKRQLNSKVGWCAIPTEKGADGYYHLLGFASQDAYADYLTDPETNADLKLLDVPIPLVEEQQGVANSVKLTRTSPASIVTNTPRATVTVEYEWKQRTPDASEWSTLEEDAHVVVSCRTLSSSGSWGAWNTASQFTVNVQSGTPKTVDVSRFLTSDATYQIRLVATGELSGVTASPVVMTVVYSNVGLTYAGELHTVCQATQAGTVTLPFRVTGNVQKELWLKVNGKTKAYALGTSTFTDSTYGAVLPVADFALSRGAVSVEAWVAFGEEYAAQTSHIAFQFIYRPYGDTSTAPILAVTDVVEEFSNWTRATIFRYAMFNPAGPSSPLRIRIQDADTYQTYIASGDMACDNGVTYDFSENFALQREGEEQPAVLNLAAVFTDHDGNAYPSSTLRFTCDNSDNYAPTSGADLVVAPERQSIMAGGTEIALADCLRDSGDTNSGWRKSAQTDSSGAVIDVPVLTVAAGNLLTLPYTLFDSGTGCEGGSMTVEIDMLVRNIVAEGAVVDASAVSGSSYTGLKVYPTRAVCLSRGNTSEDSCDAGFAEDVRQHIAVNIVHNIRGNNAGMNLVRLFVNSRPQRSYLYSDNDRFIPSGGEGAKAIVVGSPDADVDIFGIRVYKGREVGFSEIQADYMATMPTIEDKKAFRAANAIYTGSEISYEACNSHGLNTILRRIPKGGHYPSKLQPGKQAGVDIDVRIYTERGNAESLDTAHSGRFHAMTDKGQGTSAMGYYWWNIADSFADDVEIDASEYDPSDPTHYAKDGKHYRKVSYFNSLDGTSQVYASSYEIEDGRSGITKLVGKANYASPMQSHKLGGTWSYDELWQRIVNDGSEGRPVLRGTRAACFEKPFLCFYQIGDGAPVFCGFQTWGSGKGDKKTFGYDKAASPGYLCVSGADNGAKAALFQMPWDVSQDASGRWSGNIYPKAVTIDTGDTKNGYCYKAGSADTLAFEVEIGSKYDAGEAEGRIADEAKGQTETTLYTHFADFCNFCFALSPLLLPYEGTAEELMADTSLRQDHQYWLYNNTEDRFRVYYYNPATSRFEPCIKMPASWGADGRAASFGSLKLTDQVAQLPAGDAAVTVSVPLTGGGTQQVLPADAVTSYADNPDVLNSVFKQVRVALFKLHDGAYHDRPDTLFKVAFEKLMAATDNRTKNTYPWIDPAVDLLVRWKADDVDTILATDNQGRQTKPYHVLEHTKDPDGTNYWNGENNVFFTLLETAYPDEIRSMMNRIFTEMAAVCGSVDDYFQQRFFWVQEYFPAVAYNETNRVLYETAQLLVNRGDLSVSQSPITQAVGDQLQCERQFLSRRLPMLMSWCEYEADDTGSLRFRSGAPAGGGGYPTYTFDYTAYQYIYPKMTCGGAKARLYYAGQGGEWVEHTGTEPYLCAPDETVRMVITTDTNTAFSVAWMHYAKAVGNLGILPVTNIGNDTVSIAARRLRSLECRAVGSESIEFRISTGISIVGCPSLEEIDFTGASAFKGILDTGSLMRLRRLKLIGTAYSQVVFPASSALLSATLPDTIATLVVDGQPRLSALALQGVENLTELTVTGEHQLASAIQPLAESLYNASAPLKKARIDGIVFRSFPSAALLWLCDKGAQLTGKAALSGQLNFNGKLRLARAWGDIDSAANPLHVTYTAVPISALSISGPIFVGRTGSYDFNAVCTPAAGNDFAVGADGLPAIRWSLDEAAAAFAFFPDPSSGVLEVTALDRSGTDTRYAVTVQLTKSSGDTLSASETVGFWRRVPHIGDFAYADGSFDDLYHPGKTVVGIVFKRDEMWQGPDDLSPIYKTGYDKLTDEQKQGRELVGYRVLVDAKEHVSYKSTDNFINTNSVAWGLYPSDNSNGHTAIQTEISAATEISSIFDIPGIANIGSRGLTGGTDNNYQTLCNYIDVYEDDGFKDYSSASGCVVDWQGKQKTMAIVNHANQIINAYLLSDDNESVNTFYTDDDNVGHELSELPTTMEELANAMEVLHKANNNLTKYQQFLYPAAYGCYLYEPQVKGGETLDPQYKSTNWYLPAAGEQYRQYSFFAMSRTGGMGDTYSDGQNTSPARSVIDNMITEALNSAESNEIKGNVSPSHVESSNYTALELAAINRYFHNMIESQKPIYSMLLWRTLVTASAAPFTQHSTGFHWTSTERSSGDSWYVSFGGGGSSHGLYYGKCYTYVVRPTVAYQFIL